MNAAALLLASLLALPAAYAAQPISVAGEGITKTARLKNWKIHLDDVNKIGTVSRGVFCSGATDLAYSKNLDQYLVRRVYLMFNDKSKALGYPKYESSESTFADNASGNSADLQVGFMVTAINSKLCWGDKELSGTTKMTLKVELFSSQLQKVVYSRALEGSYSTPDKVKENLYYDGLVASILDQMFADPKYVDAFRDSSAAPAVTATDLIVVRNGVKPRDKVKDNARNLQSAVVTVETGGGTGSGFYVGRDGYIITNRHVVGEEKYVKVRLPGGYAVPGEVLRKDSVRDVALIKTNIEPPTPVYIRQTPAKTGDEVFAIGSPFGAALNSTVTRGIFSSQRKEGEQEFIQSDVAINPGNSGGPLFDAEGGLIAIAALHRKDSQGINLFIPINEALDKLGISLQ